MGTPIWSSLKLMLVQINEVIKFLATMAKFHGFFWMGAEAYFTRQMEWHSEEHPCHRGLTGPSPQSQDYMNLWDPKDSSHVIHQITRETAKRMETPSGCDFCGSHISYVTLQSNIDNGSRVPKKFVRIFGVTFRSHQSSVNGTHKIPESACEEPWRWERCT